MSVVHANKRQQHIVLAHGKSSVEKRARHSRQTIRPQCEKMYAATCTTSQRHFLSFHTSWMSRLWLSVFRDFMMRTMAACGSGESAEAWSASRA